MSICYRCKEEALISYRCRVYNENNIWTGQWICTKCNAKEDYHKNIAKIANCRNKQLDPMSNHGKGFIGEQIFCKARGAINCNLKLDNWRSKIDVIDIEYGKIEIKTPCLSDGRWAVSHLDRDFDYLVVICMDSKFEHVERIYIISKQDLYGMVSISITKHPFRMKSSKWDYSRKDEQIYDDAFHSMKIENCPVLRNI